MNKESGFSGEPIDANDLVYLRSRYYDPELGTFLSLDPSEGSMNDPMSLNGYAYAHGNPVNRTDPSGSTPLNVIGSSQLAGIMNAGLCASMNAALLQGCDIITFLLNGFSCPTPTLPPFVTNTPQPTDTPTPTETPTPSPTPVGDLRRRAITLAAFSEAGGLTEDDRRVVLFNLSFGKVGHLSRSG
jgi:RHS repeat-associated protein